MTPQSTNLTRQLSQRSVFEALLHRSPISRADLAKVTGLSKQTTSEVIDAFEQQGLVRPIGRTSGNVGRTAVLYELSPEGGHVLGIDLGARRLTVALADIAGRVLAEAAEPTDNRGGAWAIDQIARLSDRLARDNHTHPSRIRSIVLATPGVVNPKSGAIEMAPNIAGLGQLNVVGLLGEKLGGRVVFENDINLALLGEIWHGCAQNLANVAFLALGSGVGLGLYVNGQLVRGENGAAGEIAYLPIGGDPLQAESRLQGCLEYQVGATGVVRRYREAGGSEVESVRQVFERAQAGDTRAADVVDETARLTASCRRDGHRNRRSATARAGWLGRGACRTLRTRSRACWCSSRHAPWRFAPARSADEPASWAHCPSPCAVSMMMPSGLRNLRPPCLFHRPAAHINDRPIPAYCFAADLGGTKLAAAIADARGRILAELIEPTDAARRSACGRADRGLRRQAGANRRGRSHAGASCHGGSAWGDRSSHRPCFHDSKHRGTGGFRCPRLPARPLRAGCCNRERRESRDAR